MKGVLLRGPDDTLAQRAKAHGLKVTVSEALDVPFDKTLIAVPGTRVPFDLLPAAWHFLDRWDAAVPLWRYGVTAADVGTESERTATEAAVGDQRVLLHAVELLFVRNREAGPALVDAWKNEMAEGGDDRLAFLRALCQIKPRLCVLPRTWLAEVQTHSRQAISRRGQRDQKTSQPLVRVELEPGRFVKCHAGDEEKVRAQFERQRASRR